MNAVLRALRRPALVSARPDVVRCALRAGTRLGWSRGVTV